MTKMGAKKTAKLAEKARKREEREADERFRAHQQKLEDEAFKKRKMEEQLAEQKEEEEKERKRKDLEAQKAKEQAEFEKWQKLMNVDAEFEESTTRNKSEEDEFRKSFVDYIQEHKCVQLDHLCLEFNLKTAACVELLEALLANNQLTGVLDDRGMFVHISMDEHKKIAKFIQQRGKIQLSELSQNASRLIDLIDR
ncbi:DDRGK domain-containing protein 1 [Cichlidogyrus casuarinus]|uniref:DDRGK domain-containing protein 1 n=1 Tax=Cichlidogyrus casuarinus TaxID=1844966 RepID=A0ABD2QCJ0_9PLAT